MTLGMVDGVDDGISEGSTLGLREGMTLGGEEGVADGALDGMSLGMADGAFDDIGCWERKLTYYNIYLMGHYCIRQISEEQNKMTYEKEQEKIMVYPFVQQKSAFIAFKSD